jgi:hypothetical protein
MKRAVTLAFLLIFGEVSIASTITVVINGVAVNFYRSHAPAHSLIHKFFFKVGIKKIRFFEKIGFLSRRRYQKNPIF